jgi:CheY-like chemotaxis protein
VTLLVVDDDPVVRQVTCRMLDEAGFLSAAAASSKEALLLMDPDARPSQRPFDLLVLDIRLPDASGLELARTVKQRRPALPILFVSGYPELLGEGLPESVSAFLAKPFTSEQLIGAVRQLLLEGPTTP